MKWVAGGPTGVDVDGACFGGSTAGGAGGAGITFSKARTGLVSFVTVVVDAIRSSGYVLPWLGSVLSLLHEVSFPSLGSLALASTCLVADVGSAN